MKRHNERVKAKQYFPENTFIQTLHGHQALQIAQVKLNSAVCNAWNVRDEMNFWNGMCATWGCALQIENMLLL